MSRSGAAIEPPIPTERAGTSRGPMPPWAWSDGARVLLASVAIVSAVVLAVSSRDSGHDRDRGRGRPTVARSVSVSAPDPAERGGAGLVLDANTAPAEALETLPHVGPTLARRIVEARAEGAFRSLPDLQARVRGIGPVTLARITPYLRIDERTAARVQYLADAGAGADRPRRAAGATGRKPPRSRARRAGDPPVRLVAKVPKAAEHPVNFPSVVDPN